MEIRLLCVLVIIFLASVIIHKTESKPLKRHHIHIVRHNKSLRNKLVNKLLTSLSESKNKICRIYFVAPIWENWTFHIFGKKKAITICTTIKKIEPAKIGEFHAQIG